MNFFNKEKFSLKTSMEDKSPQEGPAEPSTFLNITPVLL